MLVSPDVNYLVLVRWKDLMHLHVIPASFPAVAATTASATCFEQLKNKVLSTYTEVFSDQLGTRPMKVPPMNIFFKDNAIVFWGLVLFPKVLRKLAHMEIDKHLACGVLVKCEEPADWCAPWFFVPKGDGKCVRLVTDYTKLNKMLYVLFTLLSCYKYCSSYS